MPIKRSRLWLAKQNIGGNFWSACSLSNQKRQPVAVATISIKGSCFAWTFCVFRWSARIQAGVCAQRVSGGTYFRGVFSWLLSCYLHSSMSKWVKSWLEIWRWNSLFALFGHDLLFDLAASCPCCTGQHCPAGSWIWPFFDPCSKVLSNCTCLSILSTESRRPQINKCIF